jgi:hypothetical protein
MQLKTLRSSQRFAGANCRRHSHWRPHYAPASTAKLTRCAADTARRQGHSERTITALANWVTIFLRFHRPCHPRALQLCDVAQFLEQVGKTARDPVIAIEEARIALEFLYHDVLCRDLGELPRPQPPRLLDQVRQVLRVRHYALTTEHCYERWSEKYDVPFFIPVFHSSATGCGNPTLRLALL